MAEAMGVSRGTVKSHVSRGLDALAASWRPADEHPTDTRHADLERRLRAAADAVPSRPVPADAWVELQSRLATRDGRHSRRFLAAAAVVALLLALVGAAALLDDGSRSAGPAGGSTNDDLWATREHPRRAGRRRDPDARRPGDPARARAHRHRRQGPQPLRPLRRRRDGSAPAAAPHATRTPTTPRSRSTGSPATRAATLHGVVAARRRPGHEGPGLDGQRRRDARRCCTPAAGRTPRCSPSPCRTPGPPRSALVAYSDATGTVLQAVDLGRRLRQRLAAAVAAGLHGTATGTWPQPGSGEHGRTSPSTCGAAPPR